MFIGDQLLVTIFRIVDSDLRPPPSLGGFGFLAGKFCTGDENKISDINALSIASLESVPSPKYATESELAEAIKRISVLISSDQIRNSKVELEGHRKNDFTPHLPLEYEIPSFIVYPHLTVQVSQILKVCHEYSVPVVPYGGGTSLEGHFFSTRQPCIVMDVSHMKRILRVNRDDMDATVEAGVNWMDLNSQLDATASDGTRLMFGPDCGPNGLILGMVSTNASGINAYKYGAMISNVVNITVVLADGTIIKTRQRPRKTSAGYNLTGLFIGSEGTLGVVTEVTVKLHVRPKYELVVVGQFPSLRDCTDTVQQVFASGIQPNAIELMDKDMMYVTNYSGYLTREWLEIPTLFFKVGGINPSVVEEQRKMIEEISMQHNVNRFVIAHSKEEEEELFSARKNAFYAMVNYGLNEIGEDVRIWVTDIAVPITKLSLVLTEINTMIKESGLFSVVLGHVGDGNFHADVYYRPEQKEQCEKIIKKMVALGLANEGTCTGEHGIGNAKRNYLVDELGEDAISLMRKIKLALDPKRILNPDKVFKIDPSDSGRY
ncbi:uncharacterized protein KQ657_000269 [Scheffersomyces spartinae]|uniref:D-lactate dehydrogenase (cytochrome) n=1 Tax=Scheffersomyces spartinae TaxID=45513 RepID=A0A9P7VEB1_9ASCO|nr:uncharacterized protein KQ657_000269 [Scheffersomyces spartinae]KAG7196254.1 hypothetical protein KQ657_000269 [Scheffersomyces spartinae]